MSTILVILMGTVLVNTFWLMQSDAGLGGTRKDGSIASAIRIGAVTGTVLVISAVIANAIWWPLSDLPRDLLLFVFAVSVVATAISLQMLGQTRFPSITRALASDKLLIVSNALALGASLLETTNGEFASTLLYVSIVAVLFAASLAAFTALIARLSLSHVPAPFRTAPITLISAGLVTLALMGFTGILRG